MTKNFGKSGLNANDARGRLGILQYIDHNPRKFGKASEKMIIKMILAEEVISIEIIKYNK